MAGRRWGGVAAVTGNGDALEAVIRHATLIDDYYIAIEPTVEALAKSADTSLVPGWRKRWNSPSTTTTSTDAI